jgi:Uma2 family endonuclease
MGLALEKLPNYTYDDYILWEGKWELIEGIPYAMSPAPSTSHQKIQLNLALAIRNALIGCKQCELFLPIDWKVNENTVLQPDLSVFCQPFEGGAFITKAPAIAVEIFSPSTQKKDKTVKFDIYLENGVKYYVMINPFKKIVEIYSLTEGSYEKTLEAESGPFTFDLGECKAEVEFSEIW